MFFMLNFKKKTIIVIVKFISKGETKGRLETKSLKALASLD